MKNPFAALIGVFLTLSIAMAGCSSSSGSAESSSSEENNRVSSSQTASRSSEEEDNIPVSNTTELTVRFGDDGEPFVMHLEKNSTAEAIAGYVGTSDWQLPVYSYDESDVMEYYDIPSRYEIPDNTKPQQKPMQAMYSTRTLIALCSTIMMQRSTSSTPGLVHLMPQRNLWTP